MRESTVQGLEERLFAAESEHRAAKRRADELEAHLAKITAHLQQANHAYQSGAIQPSNEQFDGDTLAAEVAAALQHKSQQVSKLQEVCRIC